MSDANKVESRNLAIVEGDPLPELPVATLGETLVRAAAASEQGEICYIAPDGSEQRESYPELLDTASRILAGIRRGGAQPGDKIVIQTSDDPALLATFWAAVLGGFVAVPVSANPPPNSPVSAPELLAGVWSMLDRAWVVTDARRSGESGPETPVWTDAWLGAPQELLAGGPDHDWYQPHPDDLAALLLTSGSTGLPKAVRLSHRNILSRSAATAQVRGLTAGNRSFNWMPLDHVGGLIMFHARDVFLGCHQVHAPIEWVLEDPLRWLDAINRHRSNTTWAPNFAFSLINDRAAEIADRQWNLSCLRYIMNGGESIKARVIRRFLELLAPSGLPADAMHPGWGMSETSAGVVDHQFSAENSSDDDRFVPVGAPHPGVSIRVVDERGDLLPEGAAGLLQASGVPITSGYYNNPGQNRQSFTNDGWFKTGDLAFISGGVLTVTGRVDDVLDIGGVSYHGHEIEATVEELPFVEPSYTVVCPISDAEDLAIFFHSRSDIGAQEAARLVRQRVQTRFGIAIAHVLPVAKDEIPKTGIGKLRRAQLRGRILEQGTYSSPA